MKLTDYLAIYGALLSTTIFVWNWLNARPQVRVRLTFAVETKDGNLRSGMGVSIQNPSAHKVHVMSASFLYPYHKPTLRGRIQHLMRYRKIPRNFGWCHVGFSLHNIEDGCPITLEPGMSHYMLVPFDTLAVVLAQAVEGVVKVEVQDALWRNTVSGPFSVPRQKMGSEAG